MLITGLLFLLTAVFVRAVYRASFGRLAGFPGPKIARYTGLWRSWLFLRGKWHEEILVLHKQYGKIVRIAPNELSVVDYNTSQRLYGRGCISRKTSWYNVWVTDPTAPGMFATQNEKQHSFLRKRVARAYSMSTILASEGNIQDCVTELVRRLGDYADGDQVMDMSFWTAGLAFDIVGKLTLGTSLGMVASGTDVMGLAGNIFHVFAAMSNLGNLPGQAAILNNRITMRLMSWIGESNPMTKFQAWSIARIKDRIELDSSKKPDDMLSHFLAMKGETKAAASPEDVIMEVMIAIGAGADTVASAMRSCLLYICSHPDVYRRVQSEVDSLDETTTTHSSIQNLPYLHAACHEAMRLLPPITFPLPRSVATDLEVEGYSIPAGTVISVSPGAHNRDPVVFGPDADCFRPQRWLDDKSLAQKVMTFGGDGPRNCIGQNLALVEIYVFIALMIRTFEITLGNSGSPWNVTSYWIAYQRDMIVRLARRNAKTYKRVA